MQSFIIVERERGASESIVASLCEEHQIHKLDITIVESNKSIGIEDVRVLQKSVFLKPIRSSKKVVVIKNAHTATIQAQNALLKLLEEPPANTLIILTASKKEFLLPTILSRCSVIEEVSKEQKEAHGQLHHPILTVPSSSAKRLHLAQEVGKTREDALIFLEEAITAAHTILLNSSLDLSTLNSLRLLRSLQETNTIIATTNVSPRLALEHLLLNL